MTNNDIICSIRYTFDFSDSQMIEIFALVNHQVTREAVTAWLSAEEHSAFQECDDTHLAIFLNGLIVHMRGKKDGPAPEPENLLSNNMILMKLKIALNLKADEVLEILNLAEFIFSKHELSALFRKKNHKHYRECKDQILRNFLKGMQLRYRENRQIED